MNDKIKHYATIEVTGQMNDAPEMRHVGADSIPLASARLGVKCNRKDKGEWKTTWMNFNLKAWREAADELAKIPGRSTVLVRGGLTQEEWVGRGGEVRTSFVINVESVERLGEVAPPKSQRPAPRANDTGSAFGDGSFEQFAGADDTPF